MTRVYAADDIETIARRLAELDAERAAQYGCACEWIAGTNGERVRLTNSTCPAHGAPAAVAGMFSEAPPLRQRRLRREREAGR